MSLTERIAVVIDANAKGAVRGLAATGTAADGVSKKTLGARASMAVLQRTQLASTAVGQKFAAGVNQQGTALGGLQASGIGAGKALGVGVAAGAVAAGTALASFAIDGIGKFEEATGEVRKLQRTMGGTAEDASKLRFASKLLGVDLDAVSRGAGLMAKSIGNGTSKLQDYGVEVAHDSQGNVDMAATIANVTQAFQATEDPAKRAAIGAAAFGRGWQQMAPILGKSKAELKELYDQAGAQHQLFSSDDLEQGRKLSLATRELNSQITGLKIELGKGLVPVVTQVTTGITQMTQSADKLAGVVGTDLGGAMGTFIDGATDVIPGVGFTKQAMDLFGDSSDDAADKTKKHTAAEERRAVEVEKTKAASDRAAAAIERQTKATEEVTEATIASFSSDIAAQQAVTSLGETLKISTDDLEKQSAALDTAASMANAAEDAHVKMGQGTFTAEEKSRAFRPALMQLAAQFPQLQGLIAGYIGQLGAVPTTVSTVMHLDLAAAHASLEAFRHRLATDPGFVIKVNAGVIGVAAGGVGMRK